MVLIDTARTLDEDIGTPCTDYESMQEAWELILDIDGGTRGMREARTRRLPQKSLEPDESYNERLGQTLLYPGFSDAIRKLKSKPFAKPVTIAGQDALHPALAHIRDDADNAKKSITSFARDMYEDALKFGLSHFIVEFVKRDPLRPVTSDETRSGKAHPYFVHAKATSLIGWQSEYNKDTERWELLNARIREVRKEARGNWGMTDVVYIRVLTRNEWELWRHVKDKTYELVEKGSHGLGIVPLVTVYFDQTAFMCARPPLEELAWTNLAHWQVYADSRNSLGVASVPFLSENGVPQDKLNEKFVLSAGRVHRSAASPSNHSIAWVETNGTALQASSDHLRELESRMQMLGMQPLIDPSSARTATEVGAEHSANNVSIRDWVGRMNDALYEGYRIASLYIDKANAKLPEDFAVQVHSEFELLSRSDADVQMLLQLYAAGAIKLRRLLIELQRRGIFGEDFKLEEELADDADEKDYLSDEMLARIDAMRARRAGGDKAKDDPNGDPDDEEKDAA